MTRIIAAAVLALCAAFPARAAIDIQEVTTPGGFTAWLVEERSIPFVALELRFRGGASLDAADKRGAIHLMNGLLEEGAGDLDAQGFSVALEELAAEFSFDVADDQLAISAKFLTENREEALALLRSVLLEPRFDPAAIERVRGQVLANIASAMKDPDDISMDAFDRIAFPGHPYGSAYEGTPESVTALTRDDLIAAKDRVMTRDRVYISAVGDIGADELGPLLDDLLSDLPEEGAPFPDPAGFNAPGGVTVVDFDTPQSVVTFGQAGVGREDEDFFPAFILTQIIGGGGFNSRLMEEVRRNRGLTYGIYAGIYAMEYTDMILGRVSTVNDRVAETVAVVREEWEKVAEDGVTPEELDRAITYLTGAYPLRFDGNERIANILVGMQMDGYGIDYPLTRNDRIRAVTLEDVRRVAAERISPDDLVFVVVGEPEGLEASN
ncbi:MAG: pitrilysin family protein [Pseudomonadota bacterium]